MEKEKVKLCDHCKLKHPAKHYIQQEGSFLLVCGDCSKKLTHISADRTKKQDISRVGIYETDVSL